MNRPATGCVADAEKRLLGKGGPRHQLALRLRLDQGERDSLHALAKDPAFRTATSRWRACMKEAGFTTAKDPQQLVSSLSPKTTLAKQPAARADVACKHTTGYLTKAYAGLAALQERWLDANPRPAAEWRSLRHHEAAAAAKLLETG